jgi:hypothetical protein
MLGECDARVAQQLRRGRLGNVPDLRHVARV